MRGVIYGFKVANLRTLDGWRKNLLHRTGLSSHYNTFFNKKYWTYAWCHNNYSKLFLSKIALYALQYNDFLTFVVLSDNIGAPFFLNMTLYFRGLWLFSKISA